MKTYYCYKCLRTHDMDNMSWSIARKIYLKHRPYADKSNLENERVAKTRNLLKSIGTK